MAFSLLCCLVWCVVWFVVLFGFEFGVWFGLGVCVWFRCLRLGCWFRFCLLGCVVCCFWLGLMLWLFVVCVRWYDCLNSLSGITVFIVVYLMGLLFCLWIFVILWVGLGFVGLIERLF